MHHHEQPHDLEAAPTSEGDENEKLPEHPLVRIARSWQSVAENGHTAFSEVNRQSFEATHGAMTTLMRKLAEDAQSGRLPEVPAGPEAIRAWYGLQELYWNSVFAAARDFQQYLFTQQETYAGALHEATHGNWEPFAKQCEQFAETIDIIARQNPEAIADIAKEVGFHFENEQEYTKVAETDRSVVYLIHPLVEGVEIDPTRKPVLLLSPFILSDGIQALLPHQGISFAHSYAHRGIPTYIVQFKDIMTTPAVAEMTPEDIIDDVAVFLEELTQKHGLPATVVGTCQGAYMALAGFVSGKWHGLADQLIQNVPPNDLTKSPEWNRLLEAAPPALLTVDAITVTLPNGTRAVSGEAAALAMRLKDPSGRQNPLSQFLQTVERTRTPLKPQHAAVQHWLGEVRPLPEGPTRMSNLGARIPIADDGTMPYELYGKPVSFLDAFSRGGLEHIHIIAGDSDDVVTPEVALAPCSLEAVKEFLAKHPTAITHTIVRGGHIAPMTSAVVRGDAPGGVYAEGGAVYAYEAFEHQQRHNRPEERLAA